MLSARQQLVLALQQKLQQQIVHRQEEQQLRVTSGSPAFDRLLQGGFRRGSLVEWLGAEGSGATVLAWCLARRVCRQPVYSQQQSAPEKELLVVVDPRRRFYPPAALQSTGTDDLRNDSPRNIVFTHPAHRRDQEWTVLQALNCPGVAAVLTWPDRLDDRAFRRLQLAAEIGGAIGLLVRDPRALREPSWADVRLLVQGLPTQERRRFRVEVQRCRGSNVQGQAVEVELNEQGTLDAADPVPVVSQLAGAAPAKRSSRA